VTTRPQRETRVLIIECYFSCMFCTYFMCVLTGVATSTRTTMLTGAQTSFSLISCIYIFPSTPAVMNVLHLLVNSYLYAIVVISVRYPVLHKQFCIGTVWRDCSIYWYWTVMCTDNYYWTILSRVLVQNITYYRTVWYLLDIPLKIGSKIIHIVKDVSVIRCHDA